MVRVTYDAFLFLHTERDVNGDTLWVWCYPSVGTELREVLLSKCCLTKDSLDLHTFVFGQFCRTWYYITTVEVQEPSALNKVLCKPRNHPATTGRNYRNTVSRADNHFHY